MQKPVGRQCSWNEDVTKVVKLVREAAAELSQPLLTASDASVKTEEGQTSAWNCITMRHCDIKVKIPGPNPSAEVAELYGIALVAAAAAACNVNISHTTDAQRHVRTSYKIGHWLPTSHTLWWRHIRAALRAERLELLWSSTKEKDANPLLVKADRLAKSATAQDWALNFAPFAEPRSRLATQLVDQLLYAQEAALLLKSSLNLQ